MNKYLSYYKCNIDSTVIAKILDGKEDAVSFCTSLKAYEKEDRAIQKSLLYMTYALAMIDGTIDDNENEIINKIEKNSNIEVNAIEILKDKAIKETQTYRCCNNEFFEKPCFAIHRNLFYRILLLVKTFFLKLFKRHCNISDSENEYKEAIKKCADVASVDFANLKPSYEKVISDTAKCIDDISQYRRTLSLEKGLSFEVANIVKEFINLLNENVLKQSTLAEESLAQKERTVSDFTISLIGRTKAGKSTLHAILTNQGSNKIGTGKQRTTRYNRVHQWNMMRLIDTPGIGSSEAEGRTDDEIAASILGETDIICFVIVDDSILKDVLEFIEKIASLNKPIIIILNHKENITNDIKFRKYIERPKDWLLTKGESSLIGHVNRIKKYAADKGFEHLIKVYPVFLLAAQLAGKEEYKKYSDVLWESSNIDTFIEQLKDWIVSSGTIKRSQTILDESGFIFKKSYEYIEEVKKPIIKQITKLKKEQCDKISILNNVSEKTIDKIREVLNDKFNTLANEEALLFAEEFYNSKRNLGECWTEYLERIKFEEDVKESIEKEINVFMTKADDIIKDLFEDFYYSIQTDFNIENIKVPIQLNIRAMTRIAGSLIGTAGSIVLLAGFNVVGLILAGVGILLGLSSMLFTSKEKKEAKGY